MPSRYIRCQSPDSNSQSQPSSNEAEETHSDDEDESNAMSDHSNPAQDPVVDHESYGKVVEIVDESDNVTKKRDFKSKDIHKLRDGDRVLVQFNSAGQLIGDYRSALSRWMVSLMKEPNLCPRGAKDFKEVKENYGAELLRNLRLKFLIPKCVDVEKALLTFLASSFEARGISRTNTFSNKLKQHQFAMTEIEEELDKLPCPKDFSVPQWSKYKNYLKSAEFKKYSQNGKAARALKSHMHTTRTKSFTQCRAEFDFNIPVTSPPPPRVTKSQVKCLRDGSLITRNDGDIIIDDATTTKLHHLQNVSV
ncbi:hypothetical protein Cgig2_014368 [Carnegiea gigantea]|uniref:Uncharacterized protein n=1 Tax=Carnegiea gigantea TaxID=171969 RepID=A0A9Q1QHE6_9CARY|nr:hypothetical protein Cgig2_014368 [Carnegiea gigantea]